MPYLFMNQDVPWLEFSCVRDEFDEVTAVEERWYTHLRPLGYRSLTGFLERRRAPKHRAHVDQLLLGEELSRRGILETLQYFSQDQELGMGTQVWIVRGGTAAEAISAEQERGVESRLSTIQTDSEMGMAGMTRTVGETLTSLMEDGSAYLPGLVPGEDGVRLDMKAPARAPTPGQLAVFYSGDTVLGSAWIAGSAQRGPNEIPTETERG